MATWRQPENTEIFGVKYRPMFIYKIILFLVLLILTVCNVKGQNNDPVPEISQINRNIAEITDPESIQMILDDFLIPESAEALDRIEIIDVSDIGFGDNDILVLYPTLEVHLIDDPSPALEEIMRGWSLDEQRRDAGAGLDADYFYPHHADTLPMEEIDESELELVQNSIIADLLQSVNRNYDEDEISLRFERDDEGFTFQLWNYDEDALAFSPRPPATPDSVEVNDLLYVLYSDSTVVADTTLHDIMYINKTVEETIYSPPVDEGDMIQTQSLPGSESFNFNIDELNLNSRRE